jgi:hypothetical protein
LFLGFDEIVPAAAQARAAPAAEEKFLQINPLDRPLNGIG